MSKAMTTLLHQFCGACHTNDDYDGDCHRCPAGQLIYECRKYLIECVEEDKKYSENAKRGDSEKWLALSAACRSECNLKRRIKNEARKIQPHPFFYAQWIFESSRAVNPTHKLQELTKDLEFIQTHRFGGIKFQMEYERQAKLRMREELEPFLED